MGNQVVYNGIIGGGGSGISLPSQTGNSGKVLGTDGSTPSWVAQTGGVSLPSQAGQSGKFLTTNGSTTSWATTSGSGGGLSATQVQQYIGYVNIMDFVDVVGDGVADDTIAIQTAIDYVIYDATSPSKVLFFPPNKKFRITGTLHVGYGDSSLGTNSGYSTCVLYSTGNGAYDINTKGAKIIADFDNGPAINIQGGLGVVIQGLYIEGRNRVIEGYQYPRMVVESWYTRYSDNGGADGKMTSAANIVDGTRRGHMGIAIDMAAASVADATEPWPVAPPYGYGKIKSSDVKIIACTIKFFVTAICDHPSDTAVGSGDSNGDFIEIRGNIIKQNKYGISVGNTQARLVNVIDNKIDIFWKGIVTGQHGRQKGRINFVGYNHLSGYQAFDLIDLSINGPITLIANYSESLIKIGRFNGGGTAASAPVFIGNTWNLGHIDAATLQPNYILDIDNGTFIGDRIESPFLGMLVRGTVTFENCQIRPVTDANQFNGVGFDWNTTNDGVFGRGFNSHTISVYGDGEIIYKEGCTAIIEGKTFGGYRYALNNQINNGKKYLRHRSLPGMTGRKNDYIWRSRSRDLSSELSSRSLSGIRFSFTLAGSFGNSLYDSLAAPGDILDIERASDGFYVTVLITNRSGNNFVGTLLNNWTWRARDVDDNIITGDYYLDFDPTFLTGSPVGISFRWYYTGHVDKTTTTEALSGTIHATNTNVIENVAFDTSSPDSRAFGQEGGLYVGLVCYFYSYAGTPENITSKIYAGKITGISGTTVTLESGTMTGTVAGGTTVALFNRNPNDI